MTIRLGMRHVVALCGVLLIAVLAVELRIDALESSLRTRITTDVERSLEASGALAEATDARVDAKLMGYCEAMNEGMGVETTSPTGTFWWAGDRLATLESEQDRVFSAFEDVLTADREMGVRFRRVHKAIDNKPDWPYTPDDLAEPYLTYSEP